jgi:hypothetical protein
MPWRVFYSYSHRDAELRSRLATYLAPLRHQGKIVEWHDRKIEPGTNWNAALAKQLDSADLFILLITEHFLDSDYCFGVEMDAVLARLKSEQAKVAPVLLKPCLWEESRFSQLQIIPRNGKPISSSASVEEAFTEVASEIKKLVAGTAPSESPSGVAPDGVTRNASLDLVRGQVRSYANLYERTRQRMRPSSERTRRMEEIFDKLRAAAPASYPLLAELAPSPSPGERLAAVAILQVFASEQWIPFLEGLIGSEKPFVGYQATRALQFAVGSLDPHSHPRLLEAIHHAKAALAAAHVGDGTDRQTVLLAAERDLQANISALAAPAESFD